jgi:hypothetical protein
MPRSELQKALLIGGGVGAAALIAGLALSSSGKTQNCCQTGICPSGQTCDSTTCTCKSQTCCPNSATTCNCIDNSECVSPCTCQFGICEPPVGGCVSSSDCPPGEICQNGMCVPCTTGKCPCNQVWNPSTCSCDTLIPQYINVPLTMNTVYHNWYAYWNCAGSGNPCYGLWDNEPYPACSSCSEIGLLNFPACGSSPKSVSISLSGNVTDASGIPVCNTPVYIFAEKTSIPWTSQDGFWSGSFDVSSASTSIETDANGNFILELQVDMSVDNNSGAQCPNLICIFAQCCSTGEAKDSFVIDLSLFKSGTAAVPVTIPIDFGVCTAYVG